MGKEQDKGSDEFSVDVNKLNQSLRSGTEKLEILSDMCCIYRVSPRFRRLNEQAYTPAIVSIGPFHHGKEEYRIMEEHKRRYLVDFLKRCSLSLEDYIENIRNLETPLRNSYAERTQHSREEFMEIMAVDGAFLLEYFRKFHRRDCSSSDRIWNRQRLVNDVRFDILMIENQLPFFFLKSLFELLEKSNANYGMTLIEFVRDALVVSTGWDWLAIDNIIDREIMHLVDFIGICLEPAPEWSVRMQCDSISIPTISELHRAGVKFKPISSKSLYDLRFNNGILEIPKLKLTVSKEMIFRNMQAYEHCHTSGNYMNDYTCIMQLLINTEEDISILVQNGCIENWLQDNNAAATMINGLGKSFLVKNDNFYYAGLFQDLNAYYKIPQHKWKAMLKQKYFSNPWAIISVIAAAFLLLITTMQTIFSGLQII